MKLKFGISVLLAALLAVALVAPWPSALAGKHTASGPVIVGTDEPGDWGTNNQTIGQPGGVLGQDLLEASIGMADEKTVNFIIKVTSLPSTGGVPELSRYVWSLTVDGNYLELDGKFTNYTRGVCDPTSGQCPPPRDPGQAPFFVRGDCEEVESVTTCKEIGIVHAKFDASTGLISVPVSLELLRAKPGSVIAAGSSAFTEAAGGALVAIPSVFLSSTAFPHDDLTMDGTFVVPGGKAPKKGKKGKGARPRPTATPSPTSTDL